MGQKSLEALALEIKEDPDRFSFGVVQQRPYTCFLIKDQKTDMVGIGFSKYWEGDTQPWGTSLGIRIAAGRALKHLRKMLAEEEAPTAKIDSSQKLQELLFHRS